MYDWHVLYYIFIGGEYIYSGKRFGWFLDPAKMQPIPLCGFPSHVYQIPDKLVHVYVYCMPRCDIFEKARESFMLTGLLPGIL